MADLEATEAERHLYKSDTNGDREPLENYAMLLKGFVHYMRYGVQTQSVRQIDPVELDAFARAC
jgi:hypothetical protein